MNFFQKFQVDPALALPIALRFAPALAQIPGFVAADIEKSAGKIGQQFVIKSPQEAQGARMLRGECRWAAEKIFRFGFVRLGQFAQTF